MWGSSAVTLVIKLSAHRKYLSLHCPVLAIIRISQLNDIKVKFLGSLAHVKLRSRAGTGSRTYLSWQKPIRRRWPGCLPALPPSPVLQTVPRPFCVGTCPASGCHSASVTHPVCVGMRVLAKMAQLWAPSHHTHQVVKVWSHEAVGVCPERRSVLRHAGAGSSRSERGSWAQRRPGPVPARPLAAVGLRATSFLPGPRFLVEKGCSGGVCVEMSAMTAVNSPTHPQIVKWQRLAVRACVPGCLTHGELNKYLYNE